MDYKCLINLLRRAPNTNIGMTPVQSLEWDAADAIAELIEDIIGNDYDLDRLKQLIEADRDGRCVVLPCHIGDPVFMGMGRSKITGYEEDICDGFYIGRDGVLQVKSQCYKGNHGTYGVIGQSAELTSEAAKAALEKMKEREEP